MNARVQRLMDRLKVDKFPIVSEKAGLIMEAYEKYAGYSRIMQRAYATAHFLDNKTIFIEPDELIVGNIASVPMGMEAGSLGPTWPEDDLEDLKKGQLSITPEDEAKLRAMDEYWVGKGRTMDERQGLYYDDERLWPFIQSGILCPAWEKKDQGRGQGSAGVGWGLGIGLSLIVPDFNKAVNVGLNAIIAEAKEELKNLRYYDHESVEKKRDFLDATIISLEAVVRIAKRFGDLAEDMAVAEKDPVRKKELLEIAETCRWVPGNPARTFREGVQAFWFYWLMVASGTTPGGRFDQYMYHLYKGDIEAGRITDAEVLEVLEVLRIKIMQMNFVGGGKGQRDKWAGMARWHNWIIGGVDPITGKDATNELSYLILDAAMTTKTPHHTITLRVNDQTPDAIIKKGLEVVKLGLGMPAFISDDQYIGYLVDQGVSLEDARDFAIAGCLDVQLPGKSRNNAFGMFIVPMVLDITLHNGIYPRTGKQLGPQTGEFASFGTFEDFMQAFKIQLKHFMALVVEEHNILLETQRQLFPDAVHSALMHDGIKVGRDALDRVLPFENGSALNLVGMTNVANSMAALKKIVYDEKKASPAEMKAALDANWQGYEELQKLCLEAPKYGNGDAYVDSIARDLYQYWADTSLTFTSIYGKPVQPTGISITAHAPGGAMTGATPDGRFSGETLADGSISPAQGTDLNGPTAVMRSAMAIDQRPFMATLFNMKFHPSALQTDEDMMKLAALIRTYFKGGGKHVQFNVVSKDTLLAAQEAPQEHRDLVVRVAGYSAYFVNLGQKVQGEIIARTEQKL